MPDARGDRAVVLGVGRVELGVEAARGRHHLEHVADGERAGREAGEVPAGEHLDPDPQQPGLRRRADRVAAAHVVAGELGADRQVLALDEVVVVGELGRHVERDARPRRR